MIDDLSILRNEFEAGEESFLIQIRPELVWDRAAFERLVNAMQQCCEEYCEKDTLERWMAEGFWFIPSFVREWTSHSSFPRVHEPEYDERAYQRLDDLAWWFFMRQSPHANGTGFGPI